MQRPPYRSRAKGTAMGRKPRMMPLAIVPLLLCSSVRVRYVMQCAAVGYLTEYTGERVVLSTAREALSTVSVRNLTEGTGQGSLL